MIFPWLATLIAAPARPLPVRTVLDPSEIDAYAIMVPMKEDEEASVADEPRALKTE